MTACALAGPRYVHVYGIKECSAHDYHCAVLRLLKLAVRASLQSHKRAGMQCRVVRDEEDCPQLPCLMSAHFEALRHLNARNASGTLQPDPADRPMTRLLRLAEAASDPAQSHIVRFCKEQRQFTVAPQVEGRVRCVGSPAEE